MGQRFFARRVEPSLAVLTSGAGGQRAVADFLAKSSRQDNLGLLFGFLGVAIFAATLPLTRLSVPSLGPEFVMSARAVIAGVMAAVFLLVRGRPAPRELRKRIFLAALCLTVGFPLFSSLAMQSLPAAHGGVVIGALPLATVAASALVNRERPSPAFWICAALGAFIVGGFALLRSGGAPQWGDGLLMLAIASAAFGYAISGQLSRQMRASEVISWIVVFALPISLPLAWIYRPLDPASVPAFAWASLAYLGAMSMYFGFFAWNAGMALGGVARVSQTQLAQPFLTIGISAALVGETIDAQTLVFAVLVVGLVFVGKRLRVS